MAVAREFTPSGFFALRTPLLPFAELLQFSESLLAADSGASADALADALQKDGATLRQRLHALVERPEIREALFVASPSLEASMDVWLQSGGSEHRSVERALSRYFARMTGRATPFGLFSGCSVGTLADRTRLSLAPRSAYVRHTRLDVDCLFSLTEAAQKASELERSLPFFPNSMLYRVGARWRYVESRVEDNRREYQLAAAEATEYLDGTLERARSGRRVGELASALVESDPDGEVSFEEAIAFIQELVKSQLLMSHLTPAVTGQEPIHRLIDDLQALRGGAQLASVLAAVRDALAALDQAELGCSPAVYRRIAERLEALPIKLEVSQLFQIDLQKPAQATLGPQVIAQFVDGIALLHALAPPPRADAVSRFRDAFAARYGDRAVPLLEALDDELGIVFDSAPRGGDPAPLLADVALPPLADSGMRPWGAREKVLLRLLQRATAAGSSQIELSHAEIDELSHGSSLPLPDAFGALGTLLASSAEDVDRGDYRLLLKSVSGPSGARLLGRFCHGEPALASYVAAHLRAEEALRKEAIFAEVVHLPEGRVGNVICRPVLREHEIVFGGLSGANAERQIPLSDLSVSIVDGRVVIRSERLCREVVPRMSNAHNFSARGINAYRFLGALQTQGTIGALQWSWGVLSSAPFLPRITRGKLILSRATWNLARSELETLPAKPASALFEAVRTLRSARGLPRWVALQDGDNELPLDLENQLSVDAFVQLVRRRPSATLVEVFFDALCVEGPEGRFAHEIVLPFVRRPVVEARNELPTGPSLAPSRRTFPPGSAWLFAKLYTGTATADRLLIDVVSPLIAQMKSTDSIRQWFFVRYGDPDWHLRLRCAGDPQRLLSEVLPALHALTLPYVDAGLLWKLQLDTYERETERYGGGEGVELAERLFQADSEAVIELLLWLAGVDGSADARWRMALCSMDVLLEDLGFGLEAKYSLAQRARAAFVAEFGADVALTASLGDKFRREAPSLNALLGAAPLADARLAGGVEIIARRSKKLRSVVAELRASQQRLAQPLQRLAQSYLHMHGNRIFRADARAQELVLYDFLARIYGSRLARQSKRAGPRAGKTGTPT